MKEDKVRQFITLAGQKPSQRLTTGTPEVRALGAQLLLSEVLEYVIKGLGVIPEFNGIKITDANALKYNATSKPDLTEMVDGLCDTAYTMYWNSIMLGIPLEEAYDMVCDNNLEKFVRLDSWSGSAGSLPKSEWSCGQNVAWPPEVQDVSVLKVGASFFAVGKDAHGKVRKPSSYAPIDLSRFVQAAEAA